MEGGRAMEGRGSGVEDWRGEAHLGSSLPVSARRCPCPLVVSHVHASWPVSARHCPCLRVVARVRASLPMSARRCLCPHVLPVVRMSFPASVHVRGRSFSFVGMGGSLRSWAVVFVRGRSSLFGGVRLCSWAVHLHSWATAGCGGGELLVGGGESSGLA